jgi:tetratricopeptide (TPR) repeat protein
MIGPPASDPIREAAGLERAGLLGEAVRVVREAAAKRPREAALHRELGRLLRKAGDTKGAEDATRRAIREAPKDLEAAIQLGQVLQEVGRTDEARASFERAIWLAPGDGRAYCGIAVMLEKAREPERALEVIDRALAAAPGHQLAIVLRARMLRRVGRLDEARALAEAFVADTSRHPEARKRAWYELCRILDKVGDYAGAFRAAEQANSLQAQMPEAKAVYTTSWFPIFDALSRVTAAHTARWTREAPPAVDPAPVFLVGFPRSGTTMLEQILASHPRIAVSNERELFHHALAVVAQGLDDPSRWDTHLDALPPERIEEARRAYLEPIDVVRREKQGATVVVDKFPMHLGVVPIINRVFPEARILVAQRDPRDVCLSSFLQEFVPNRSMVHFLTLDDTVRVYERMMGAWLTQRERLSARIHEVRYESLTRTLEPEARAVLEFCGVNWDPAVVRFHEREHQRWVSTPSYEAISRPVHTEAQGRWKKYRAELTPILPRLEPFVQALGYEATGTT